LVRVLIKRSNGRRKKGNAADFLFEFVLPCNRIVFNFGPYVGRIFEIGTSRLGQCAKRIQRQGRVSETKACVTRCNYLESVTESFAQAV
jgi:hypothetical protein